MHRFFSLIALLPFVLISTASASPDVWQLGMQAPASPSAEHLHDFHNLLLYIITGIVFFVLALLLFVIIRFNKRANPVPAKFSHNVLVEVVWTVIPVIILIVIAIPSFKLLYFLDRTAEPEMTLKLTGYQWYWGYEYPDHGGVNFQSYMVPASDLKPGQVRLLSTDNPVVLPVDTNIQILSTASDVIHAWAVPALGVKIDAIPGRLNETWVNISKPGTYFGQCSEICGKDHAFMPIEIKAVPKEEFNAWVVAQGGSLRAAVEQTSAQPPETSEQSIEQPAQKTE
ncbi:MAG: cytochrome c oxidase subunit II [Alphaproteobacteria bacterium]|nr:cytochrome c oxidase subunit II [Alphaproteobacteria bacterium]